MINLDLSFYRLIQRKQNAGSFFRKEFVLFAKEYVRACVCVHVCARWWLSKWVGGLVRIKIHCRLRSNTTGSDDLDSSRLLLISFPVPGLFTLTVTTRAARFTGKQNMSSPFNGAFYIVSNVFPCRKKCISAVILQLWFRFCVNSFHNQVAIFMCRRLDWLPNNRTF